MAPNAAYKPLACVSITFLALFLALPLASAVKLFIIGDSLLDTGNANYFAGKPNQFITANFPPYGVSLTPPRPTGRFSNGRVFPDFLAEKMGIPTPPPYLSLNQSSLSAPHGINFAVAGAGALPATRLSSVNIYGEMEWMMRAMNLTVTTPTQEADLATSSIALLSIGGNDFFSFFLRTLPSFYRSGSPAIAAGVVSDTLANIQKLYNLGLRNFIVMNVGPLGCVPAYRNILWWNWGCSSEANNAALVHNSLLDSGLADVRNRLVDANIVVVDVFNSFYDAAKDLAIPVNKGACCGWPSPTNGLVQCGKGVSGMCRNPTQFMFWDFVHATESAIAEIFKYAWSGTARHARPYNLSTLFTRLNITAAVGAPLRVPGSRK